MNPIPQKRCEFGCGLVWGDPPMAGGIVKCVSNFVSDQRRRYQVGSARVIQTEEGASFLCMVLVGQMPFCRDGGVDY